MKRKFGIEYETCVIVKKESDKWIDNIKSYVKRINTEYNKYKKDKKFVKWCLSFDNKVIIIDDDNIIWSFDIRNTSDIIKEEYDIYTYKYPHLTIDSTIVCHNTLRKKKATNYLLQKDQYSINLEIVSQILNTRKEYEWFNFLFITDNIFIKNKSQGIHLNIDVSDLNRTKLVKFIKDIYTPWEKEHHDIRPVLTGWVKPLTIEKMKALNDTNIPLEDILTKTDSVRYKERIKVLEFRILSPSSPDTNTYINQLLDMMDHTDSHNKKGGYFKTRRIKSTFKTKTQKNKPIYVFVYGSLRKNLPNHYKLDSPSVQYIGNYITTDPMYMIGLKSKAYPYVVQTKIHEDLEPTPIRGELYKVSRHTLSMIDALEGYPTHYVRKIVGVYNGKKYMKAYMYILENTELIEGIQSSFHKRFLPVNHGDWVKFIVSK